MKANIFESRRAKKDIEKLQETIKRSYEIWARLVEEHGTVVLREFKGYHDEKLSREWAGYRSSRLNRQWRVIYRTEKETDIEIVTVERVSPHDYRRRL